MQQCFVFKLSLGSWISFTFKTSLKCLVIVDCSYLRIRDWNAIVCISWVWKMLGIVVGYQPTARDFKYLCAEDFSLRLVGFARKLLVSCFVGIWLAACMGRGWWTEFKHFLYLYFLPLLPTLYLIQIFLHLQCFTSPASCVYFLQTNSSGCLGVELG